MSIVPKPIKEDPTIITPDSLLNLHGKWKIVYCWNKWANNILMVLPTFNEEEDEKLLNENARKLLCGPVEYERLCLKWMWDHPDTPFMVQKGNLLVAVAELYRRFEKYHGNGNKFVGDGDEFRKWLRAMYMVTQDETGELLDKVNEEGWKSLFD